MSFSTQISRQHVYRLNNRLLTETKTENNEAVTTTYTYDANGNTLSKSTPAHGEDEASSTTYTYNGFNQLIALTVDGTDVAYAYNAQGIRTAKRVNNTRIAFLLDGGNVVAEVQDNTVTNNYLRGVNLIRRTSSSETEYYLFNAHGDVVTTTNLNGTVNQEYDYDAFGNEKNPDALDSNPFRYCGEYLDFETGTYYLRARYYDPTIGRFTQQDTHWNTSNMIYGDNPQAANEQADQLGLREYSYSPQIAAIIQSGNLYIYGVNNPVIYCDPNGRFLGPVLCIFLGIEVTVEMVYAAVGITVGTIALFKITQEAVAAVAKYFGTTLENARKMLERAVGSTDTNVSDNTGELGEADTREGSQDIDLDDVDIDNLPEGWTRTDNNGFTHIRDEKGRVRIRIDPPDKKTPYPHKHYYDANVNSLDVNGNQVSPKSPSAHIPLG